MSTYVPDPANSSRPAGGDKVQVAAELRALKQRITELDATYLKRGVLGQRVNPSGFAPATASGNVAVRLDQTGTYQRYLLAGDTTFSFVVPELPAGEVCFFTFSIKNGGAYNITWPDDVKWAEGKGPELSQTETDILVFFQEYVGGPWVGNLAIPAIQPSVS